MTKAKHILMAAVLCLLALPAFAADAPPASQSFGIVDTTRVLQGSAAAKAVSDELEAKRKEFAAQISKEQEAFRASVQKFEKERATLSKDALEARGKALDEKNLSLQKLMKGKEQLLDRAMSESMNKLRQETTKIVGEIAKERSLSAVLTQDAVMLSVPQMDITGEVIKRLNDNVKKIPIDWSALGKDKDKKAG